MMIHTYADDHKIRCWLCFFLPPAEPLIFFFFLVFLNFFFQLVVYSVVVVTAKNVVAYNDYDVVVKMKVGHSQHLRQAIQQNTWLQPLPCNNHFILNIMCIMQFYFFQTKKKKKTKRPQIFTETFLRNVENKKCKCKFKVFELLQQLMILCQVFGFSIFYAFSSFLFSTLCFIF